MIFLSTILIGSLLVGAIMTFIVFGVAHFVPWLFVLAIIGMVLAIRLKDRNKFLEWKDEYSVGIEMIDNDHRRLLNLINQFQTAVFYRTGKEFEEEAFKELVDYTRTHFKREEDLMEEYGYPDFEAHREEHRKMIAQVEASVAAYHSEERKIPLEGTVLFLRDWLINHINGTDQEYSGYLRDKGAR